MIPLLAGMLYGMAGYQNNENRKRRDTRLDKAEERQAKLDKQGEETHSANMAQEAQRVADRKREDDFRTATINATKGAQVDTGYQVADAAGSSAFTKDKDAAGVLADMAGTLNPGATQQDATRVTPSAAPAQPGSPTMAALPTSQVFTNPADASRAASQGMTDYARLQARKQVADNFGKFEVSDDLRGKLDLLAGQGVLKAHRLLGAGDTEGALKVLGNSSAGFPEGAKFVQADVPDMYDPTKTAKGWQMVVPGAKGQPDKVLIPDFNKQLFDYLSPEQQFTAGRQLRQDSTGNDFKLKELQLKERELNEVKIPNAEVRNQLLEIRGQIAAAKAAGAAGAGPAAAPGVALKDRRDFLGDFSGDLPDPKGEADPKVQATIVSDNQRKRAQADAMFTTNAQLGMVLTAPQASAAMTLALDRKNIRLVKDNATGQVYETVAVNGAPVVIGLVSQKPAALTPVAPGAPAAPVAPAAPEQPKPMDQFAQMRADNIAAITPLVTQLKQTDQALAAVARSGDKAAFAKYAAQQKAQRDELNRQGAAKFGDQAPQIIQQLYGN
jgi:hypothetical protein